jgi:hypothetical protein
MHPPPRFRLIVIRRDGSRVVLDEFLTLADAEKLRDSLPPEAKFTEIRIEPDEGEAPQAG